MKVLKQRRHLAIQVELATSHELQVSVRVRKTDPAIQRIAVRRGCCCLTRAINLKSSLSLSTSLSRSLRCLLQDSHAHRSLMLVPVKRVTGPMRSDALACLAGDCLFQVRSNTAFSLFSFPEALPLCRCQIKARQGSSGMSANQWTATKSAVRRQYRRIQSCSS